MTWKPPKTHTWKVNLTGKAKKERKLMQVREAVRRFNVRKKLKNNPTL